MEIFGELKNSRKTQTQKSLRSDPAFSEKDLLRINPDCLRLSYQYSVSCYAMISLDYTLHLVNIALCNMLGCTDNVLLQTDIRGLIKPDDLIRFIDFLEGKKTQLETSAYCEKICLCFNGKYIWVNVKAFLIQSTQNQSSYYILLLDVISFRKLARAQGYTDNLKLYPGSEYGSGNTGTSINIPIRKSTEIIDKENRLSDDILASVLDQSNDIVFITNENTKIIFANQKACVFLGYHLRELLTMCIEDVAPHFTEEVQIQHPLVDHQSGSIIEMYYKTKDQQSYLVEVKISLHITSERYYFYTAKDLSSRTQIYDMLWHNEQKFVAFVENSPNIIAHYDLMLCCIYANEAFEKVTGFPRSNMIEKFLCQNSFLSGEQVQLMRTNLCLVIDSGLPIEFELTVLHAISGLPVHIVFDVIPEFNTETKISGVIVVGHNITQLKHQEEELQIAKGKSEESDRLKSTFLANMSHEVRTPINSIIGFSELLADPDFREEDKKEFVQHIITNGNILLNLISDIMDISKLESGEITLRKNQINAQKFISDIQNQFVFQAEEKNLELKLIFPATDREPILFADPDRLMQIFNNLISNALKFTTTGSIEVGYQTNGEMVEFFVKDSGIGIPVTERDAIFERFRQVDTELTRKFGGNGLGLAISKNLVELMGGKIWVVSESGKGAVFHFTLPRN